MLGQIAFDKISAQRGDLKELALRIWNAPELPYQEFQASEWTAEFLEHRGFQVERRYKGLKTAIHAVWGSGKPEFAFCGEYDALPCMSQALSTKKEPIIEGACGHGCGHNILGVANVGAVIGLKEEMEQLGLRGTIHFYGCPAEEGMTGKGFLARDGAFDSIDAAVFWHPGATNRVKCNTMSACSGVDFIFHGRTAHAAADPQNGRSALDAVELCNVGVNYLREHVTSDVRIHYIITNGGVAANIVPDLASSRYIIRAIQRENLQSVYDRIVDIARGAAMMTGTEVEVKYTGGCYNTFNMDTFAPVLDACLREAPCEPWSDEDRELAYQLNHAVPGHYEKMQQLMKFAPGTELAEGVLPVHRGNGYASSDIGNVMHKAPGIVFGTATAPITISPHSWQLTVASGTEIGIKGMIYAAKTMALFALKLLDDPSIIEAAKQEFAEKRAGLEYESPIPADMPLPQ